MARDSSTAASLTWLLDDLCERVDNLHHAVVLSVDGLAMASSSGLAPDEAEHLCAVSSGLQSLARGVGRRFGGGDVRQTVIEMETSFLFVTAAGQGACLAVVADASADVGLVAYEMALLVTRMGRHLSMAPRVAGFPGGRPATR